MKKKVLVIFAIIGFLVVNSCEKDTVTEIYPDFTITTTEASILKENLKGQLPIIESLLETNTTQLKRTNLKGFDSNEVLSLLLSDLSAKSLCMLESYGINYSDIEPYVEDINDPRIAFIGMVFIALQEESISNNSVKLKSTVPEEDDEISYGLILDCLARSIVGVSISDQVFGLATKFSMRTALGIAGRVASRTMGLIGAAVAIVDFGDCIGWYDIW